MPVDTDYSLTDLARLADVTPRTIRYYVAQGLLPSPDAAGPATRYSEGHLARLRLIRRLQRDHLPLAEIRERIELMTDAEVVAALSSMGSQPASHRAITDPDATVGYIRRLMEQARIEPNVHPAPEAAADRHPAPLPAPAPPASSSAAGPPLPTARRMVSLRRDIAAPAAAAAPADLELEPSLLMAAEIPSPPADDIPLSRPSRSTWERLVITPDIEIHVRRPLKPVDVKRADHLERYARELFQDEP